MEALSAFNRLLRRKDLSRDEHSLSLSQLKYLRERWSEIQPTEDLREQSERLLRIHNLRAADSLQLAAALIWCNGRPRGRFFVVADVRLAEAAEAEGFSVLIV